MPRPIYSPCTLPAEPRPDPLVLFIQQALLSLVYSEQACSTGASTGNAPRVAA